MPRVPRKSSVVTSATEELKFERAEELDEGEMKEVIIYLPPSQDDFDSEVARSFQLSAAQRPKRLSLTVEDPKGEELEEKGKVGEKELKSPSSEDDEDEVISPSEDVTKPFGEDENKSEGGEDEEIVGRYFETLGTSSPAPKMDEPITEPPPLDTDRLMRTRLSISARFLSRSHQPGRTGVISTNLDEEKSDNHYSSSEDTKQDLQRRKEEMAQAVEATRKRLEALGWKAKEDILKKMPTSTTAASTITVTSTAITTSVSSASSTTVTVSSTINTSVMSSSTTTVAVTSKTNTVATSVSSTPTKAATGSKTDTVAMSVSSAPTSAVSATSKTNAVATPVSSTPATSVISASKTSVVATSVSFTSTTTVTAASRDGDGTPVSSSTEWSSKPAAKTNLLETRLADVQGNHKEKDRQHTEKKEFPEAKKENDTKDEDGDKSKRTASHLIAFFSQSKSSKNKDKEKENAKEKEKTKTKEKDKEKGRATPPPGKQTSDAKSAPGGKLERRGSEGKSWRKSLGILGGSSKHDKEEKHKRHSDPRVLTSQDVVAKNSQTATTKQGEKAEKSNKKQTETRSSTPPAELPTKNSQSAPAKQGERSLKTVKEEEKKSTKPQQPERRSSNPTADLALKNSQSRVKTSENATSNSKNVPLREKKGRVTGEERREKSRSLGDIDKRLHNIEEVSILDPSVPPSRTVDTMDIPDQVKTGEKRPKSSAALLESTPLSSNTPLERKLLDINGVLGMNILKENSNVPKETTGDGNTLKNTSLAVVAASNGENSTELKQALNKKPAPTLAGSGDEEISAPGSTVEKKPNPWVLRSDVKSTSKASSAAKPSRSGSGSSFMTDISELSAELSAAIASPPPEPIRLSMSEANLLSTSPPSGYRRSPIGKDHDGASASDVDQTTCQETLENLVQAFQKVVDLQSKILNEEPSDESHEVLSYISSTFSAIEDQIHESRLRRRQWELSSLPRGKPGTVSRPLGGALSFSTGNLDQLLPKGQSMRRNSEFSVSSIPEDVEIHEVLLEKYSNRLLEMVAQKLSK